MQIQAPLTFFAHGDQHHAPVQVTGLSEHNRLYKEEATGRQLMVGVRLVAACSSASVWLKALFRRSMNVSPYRPE